jgi:glycosyltransferase involved in cell wall biosynthesis
MSATVIIPTTGASECRNAIESVLNQTYNTKCYVVIDGQENFDAAVEILNPHKRNSKLDICFLPQNVGKNGFYGHRVYASFTHLINTDFVLYLDQDNWFEKNHVETCIRKIVENKLQWCYSLRKICDKDGKYLCNDDCESLGKWQSYHGVNHVDTNSYCIPTQIAVRLASAWHGGWGQDRVFLSAIAQHFQTFDCTGEYTVNYRVNGNPNSVNREFFENGNKVMNEKYNGEFPWRKKT